MKISVKRPASQKHMLKWHKAGLPLNSPARIFPVAGQIPFDLEIGEREVTPEPPRHDNPADTLGAFCCAVMGEEHASSHKGPACS